MFAFEIAWIEAAAFSMAASPHPSYAKVANAHADPAAEAQRLAAAIARRDAIYAQNMGKKP